MTIGDLYKIYQAHPSVQTDTRKLRAGDIFFGLKGSNFNGNEFAGNAIEAGAAFAVIDEEKYVVPGKTMVVKDALQTLQELARYHRQQFPIPFIAVTGSNGKTTTKELIHAVLSTTFKTYTTQGNLNNHIGIPLTLLSIKPDATMAVIEMGANHLHEIAGYCTYTLPTHGIITNCGKAHLEGFGSIEGVRKAKGELYDYLRANSGSAFVMWDYNYLQQMSQGIREIVRYGTRPPADIIGNARQDESFLSVQFEKGTGFGSVKTQLVGDYNLPNVLVAVTTGKYFNVPEEKIRSAIENYTPSNSRSQLIERHGNKIILDAYNANPTSMRAAIENFSRLQANDKILMLGGMAELGDNSLGEHREVIELIQQYAWKNVVLVGGDFLRLQHPFASFENSAQARDWYQKQKFHNAYVLIKGSRSMQMEKILE